MKISHEIAMRVSPKLSGLSEIEAALGEAMGHIARAQSVLEEVKAMTVEVTAFTEPEAKPGGAPGRSAGIS